MYARILFGLVVLSNTVRNQGTPLGEPLSPDSVSIDDANNPADTSVLEYGPGYSTYGHRQMAIARSRGITPLVDNTNENEKYGNDGDFTRAAAVSFVSLTEGISGAVSNNIHSTNKEPILLLKLVSPFAKEIGLRIAGLA